MARTSSQVRLNEHVQQRKQEPITVLEELQASRMLLLLLMMMMAMVIILYHQIGATPRD